VGGLDAERHAKGMGEGLREWVRNLFLLEVVNFVYFEEHFDKFVLPGQTECYRQKLWARLVLTVLSLFACCTKIIVITGHE